MQMIIVEWENGQRLIMECAQSSETVQKLELLEETVQMSLYVKMEKLFVFIVKNHLLVRRN